MPTVQAELVRKGVTFTNAFVVNPLCCPSRASLLTGLYSHSTGVYTNGGFTNFKDTSTLATWLRRAGYRTGFFGKYLNGYTGTIVPPAGILGRLHAGQRPANSSTTRSTSTARSSSTAASPTTTRPTCSPRNGRAVHPCASRRAVLSHLRALRSALCRRRPRLATRTRSRAFSRGGPRATTSPTSATSRRGFGPTPRWWLRRSSTPSDEGSSRASARSTRPSPECFRRSKTAESSRTRSSP